MQAREVARLAGAILVLVGGAWTDAVTQARREAKCTGLTLTAFRATGAGGAVLGAGSADGVVLVGPGRAGGDAFPSVGHDHVLA